jgi:MFS family permease
LSSATSPSAPETKVALGSRYWKLWTSSVISNLGDGVALVAYLWLASAVTRDPVLIALVAVVQRLPWLVFTLPAGVITDRIDRRKIMVWMQAARAAITLGVAFVVLAFTDSLPAPDEIVGGTDVATNWLLYVTLVVSALLFGMAEVLYDNSAQTILPAMVEPEGLERANGNLWGAEMVANSFVGPPLGSVLVAAAFALPFFFDAGTFLLATMLLLVIAGDYGVKRDAAQLEQKVDWWGEIKEGFVWLWRHPLLRPLAIILGILNMLGMVGFATFVLFAQEVLVVSPLIFAILMAAGAVGGIIGSVTAPRISKKLGSGASLHLTMITGGVTALIIGLSSMWPVVWVMFAIGMGTAVLWNVITVSLRQTIIPDALLGRVNSVYRFFGWGMMPIGLLIGGLIVSVTESAGGSRELALRMPWFAVAGGYALLYLYAAPKLTTDKIETARAEGIAAKEDAEPEHDGGPGIGTEAIAEAGVQGAVPRDDD